MTPLVPIGEGMLAMDIALLMSATAAAAVNAYYLPACFRVSRGIAAMRGLRVMGWTVLSSRYAMVLLTVGDIQVSIPGAIAIFLLAAGELYALFNRGKFVPL